jgi:shikimate dehydrogenase
MRVYGLVGFPLSHSFSKKYFTEKFLALNLSDCSYDNFEIPDLAKLPEIIQQLPSLAGLNVTRPYKEEVIDLLNDIHPLAATIRAVNTIQIVREEKIKLKGYNTDAYGFEKSIGRHLNRRQRKALILGTGATARTVAFVFGKLGIEYAFVSRSSATALSYSDLNAKLMADYPVIVNTTPVGTWPNTNEFPPLPYNELTPEHLLFDMVYNPEESRFLKNGRDRGASTVNGLEMLKFQAEKSWEIWNPETPD